MDQAAGSAVVNCYMIEVIFAETARIGYPLISILQSCWAGGDYKQKDIWQARLLWVMKSVFCSIFNLIGWNCSINHFIAMLGLSAIYQIESFSHEENQMAKTLPFQHQMELFNTLVVVFVKCFPLVHFPWLNHCN